MDSLRKFYLSLGHTAEDMEYVETSLHFLSELVLNCGIEIDLCQQGRERDFTNLENITQILSKHHEKLSRNSSYFILPFFNAVSKGDYNKHIRYVEEVALEMKLLEYETRSFIDAPNNKARELVHFMCDLNKTLRDAAEEHEPFSHQLAA